MAWAIPVALAGQWYVETAGQREQGLAGNGKTWQNQSLVEGSLGICCWRASSGLYTPMPCHKFFRKIPLYEFPAYICFDKVVLFMKGNPDMPQCGFSRAVAQAGLLGADGPKFCGTTLIRRWKRSASPTMRMSMCLVPSVNDRLLPMYAPAFSMILAMLIRLTLPMHSESLGRIDWRWCWGWNIQKSVKVWRSSRIGQPFLSCTCPFLRGTPVWSFTALFLAQWHNARPSLEFMIAL